MTLKVADIKIGTRFIKRGRKRQDINEVIDILKTYNSKNELVETKYVCQHDFMGQKVKHIEVAPTIQMGAV